MTKKYFMIKSPQKNVTDRQGMNLQPPDHQSDAHPTEPPRPANSHEILSQALQSENNGEKIYFRMPSALYYYWPFMGCGSPKAITCEKTGMKIFFLNSDPEHLLCALVRTSSTTESVE